MMRCASGDTESTAISKVLVCRVDFCVTEVFLCFYKNGDVRHGFELSEEPQLSYVWADVGRSKRNSSKRDIVVYGRVNDKSVKKISLILSNGDISEDVIIENG